MSRSPRVVYAVKDSEARLHVPIKQLPIIVVPGTMGTRLTDPMTNALVWNPVGFPMGKSPGKFVSDMKRLQQMSAELVPDETHPFDDAAERDKYKDIVNATHLIPDFYGTLMQKLAALNIPELSEYHVATKVYACGYDWRQDNARSALRLAAVVDRALRETRAEKVIIVAHSMGGLISRYYCRVLGGESRVHTLFLVGSPTLGAPGAYMQLKNGLRGLYINEFADDEFQQTDTNKKVQTGITEGLALASGALMAASSAKTGQGVMPFATSILGDVYLVLCMGAGRMVTRKETGYMARQFTSVYQLLPTTILCAEEPNWLVFDPLATGHPPTGKMILFPTLLQGAMEMVGGALDFFSSASKKIGTEFKKTAAGFFDPGASTRTSERATRNVDTLETIFRKVSESLSSSPSVALDLIKSLYAREETTFVDCRNNKKLYNDIYTGLLDLVEHRAIGAANLALSYRFDQALTVRPRDEAAITGLDLIKKILDPVIALVMPLMQQVAGGALSAARATGSVLTGSGWDFRQRMDASNASDQHSRELTATATAERERSKPRAYMHPRTVNVYCETQLTESGAMLLATAVFSNDDSNVVRWQIVPNLVDMAMGLAGGGSRLVMGDGTVPKLSGNPPDERLSVPFLIRKPVTNVSHGDMCEKANVQDAIKDSIGPALASFVQGGTAGA